MRSKPEVKGAPDVLLEEVVEEEGHFDVGVEEDARENKDPESDQGDQADEGGLDDETEELLQKAFAACETPA